MKYILRLIVLSVALVLLIMAGCRQMPKPSYKSMGMQPGPVKGEPTVRMWWMNSASVIELIVPGEYTMEVVELDGSRRPGGGSKAVTITVAPFADGIQLGRNRYKSAEIHSKSTPLRIRYTSGGKRIEKALPGSFIFSRTPKGKLQLVLRLPMEQYLTGVIPEEMPLYFPPAALQAQAVSARTFALFELRSSQHESFDVYPDDRSQVWSIKHTADTRARMAVNSTRGIVLTENNKLFPTYFHSDCGGHTAKGRYVFSSAVETALSGASCAHGQSRDVYKNKFVITKQDLSARLSRAKISNGNVRFIEALDENKQPMTTMGRVYYVRIHLDNGVVRTISAVRFRLAVGAGKRELSSTMFTFEIDSNGLITFESRGMGHGVGLCQHGAMYLANEGYDYPSILRHYYPGTTLVRLW